MQTPVPFLDLYMLTLLLTTSYHFLLFCFCLIWLNSVCKDEPHTLSPRNRYTPCFHLLSSGVYEWSYLNLNSGFFTFLTQLTMLLIAFLIIVLWAPVSFYGHWSFQDPQWFMIPRIWVQRDVLGVCALPSSFNNTPQDAGYEHTHK